MNIKLKNNQAFINKSVTLSPKQMYYVGMLSSVDKSKYIESCLGIKRTIYSIDRMKSSGIDKLAQKRPGRYLDTMRELKENDPNKEHTPRNAKGNWIGVELECVIPKDQQDCSEECGRCGGTGNVETERDSDGDFAFRECYRCNGNGRIDSNTQSTLMARIRKSLIDNKIYRASVRGDGSVGNEPDENGDVGDEYYGVEVTLLLNTDHGFEPLYKLCELLRDKFKADVNKTCGLHVHFDYSKKGLSGVRQAAKRAAKFLPILAKLVPKSRRNNHYCQLSVSKMRGDRYHAINLTSYNKHKTIEVRLHGGTLDGDKIKNWVSLMRRIFDTKVTQEVKNVQDLLDVLELPDDLATYVDERYQKFNKEEIAIEEGFQTRVESLEPFDAQAELDTLLALEERRSATRNNQSYDANADSPESIAQATQTMLLASGD